MPRCFCEFPVVSLIIYPNWLENPMFYLIDPFYLRKSCYAVHSSAPNCYISALSPTLFPWSLCSSHSGHIEVPYYASLRPLHLPFSVPGALCPQSFKGLCFFNFKSLLKHQCFSETFPNHSKMSIISHSPHILFLFTLLFFPTATHHSLIHYIFISFICL